MRSYLTEFGKIIKQYRLEVAIFLIISIFFIVIDKYSLIKALKTFFTSNVLTQMVNKQQFIVGMLFGFVILFILSTSIGIKIKYEIRKIGILLVVFSILVTWFILLIDTMYLNAEVENIKKWSAIFLRADKMIFGGYPVFWMFEHYNPVLERVIVWTYNFLTPLLTFWTGFLIASQKIEEFVLWSRSILLAVAMCIPLWIVMPAMEPLTVYLMNIFNQDVPSDILAEKAKGPPSQFINKYTAGYSRMWLDPTGERYAVSTFPSMHTIWGIILFASAWKVFGKRKILILFGFIAIANFLGAIYTLQHYTVDILAGFIISALVIWLVYRKRGVNKEIVRVADR